MPETIQITNVQYAAQPFNALGGLLIYSKDFGLTFDVAGVKHEISIQAVNYPAEMVRVEVSGHAAKLIPLDTLYECLADLVTEDYDPDEHINLNTDPQQ